MAARPHAPNRAGAEHGAPHDISQHGHGWQQAHKLEGAPQYRAGLICSAGKAVMGVPRKAKSRLPDNLERA